MCWELSSSRFSLLSVFCCCCCFFLLSSFFFLLYLRTEFPGESGWAHDMFWLALIISNVAAAFPTMAYFLISWACSFHPTEVPCFDLLQKLKVGCGKAENPEESTLWTIFLLDTQCLDSTIDLPDIQLCFPKTHSWPCPPTSPEEALVSKLLRKLKPDWPKDCLASLAPGCLPTLPFHFLLDLCSYRIHIV